MKSVINAVILAFVVMATPAVLTATAAPANAATTVSTRGALQLPSRATWGTTFTVKVAVQAQRTDGTWDSIPDTNGTFYLQRRFAGSQSYATLKTFTDRGYGTANVRAYRNAYYRVVFTGGSDGTYNFAPRTGAGVLQLVRRDFNDRGVKSGGKLYLRGDVNPGWNRRYITVQRKNCVKCSWTRYSKVKTRAHGGFSAHITAPRSGSWYYRLMIPAGNGYTTSLTGTYRAYKQYYRQADPGLRLVR